MKLVIAMYILNATLLLLHEMESAYEREWEILKLPGRITGFLLLHIPILLVLFYGLTALQNFSTTGWILGIIFGVGGVVPFLVHKLLVKREGRFERLISNLIIYLNGGVGIFLVYLCAGRLFLQ